jgi:hypothetical protein
MGSTFIDEGGTLGFGVSIGVSATEEGGVRTCDGSSSIISY